MYSYEEVRELHLEITEKCQAGCAMCARTDDSGTFNRHLKNSELTLDQCSTIFESKFIDQLDEMYMCGNFGDPIMARDTLETFEYFRDNNFKMRLKMYTNGGGRSQSWWKDLASVLSPGKVIFAIDGLEDTNHVYRAGVRWDRVMTSAEAFIGAGGHADWHFLVFGHNEHQVEDARALSKKMGFKTFQPKKTTRFDSKVKAYSHLSMPMKKEYINDKVFFLKGVDEKYGSYDRYLDQVEISCMVSQSKSIYVSADGLVFPCCWMGHEPFANQIASSKSSQFSRMIGGIDVIDAKVHGLRGVFDSGVFDMVEESWSLNSTTEGKLKICAKTCAKAQNFFKNQYELT